MKLEVPDFTKPLHTMVMPIRWGDMDTMGHVNNTVYLRYMESARIALLEEAGYAIDQAGEGFVIANLFCNFLRPLEYPGEVLVKSSAGAIGRSSFEVYHALSRSDDPEHRVYANGGATLVWIDVPSQTARALPAGLRALLGGAATPALGSGTLP